MSTSATTVGYASAARWLHWLVAGLIVVQFVLAEIADEAGEAGELLRQLAVLANHKSVGMTVLMLALVRLGWRAGHPPPPLPAATPAWQSSVAKAAHWLLYGLLLSLPISGWLMSSASAYSVSWFNLFAFPDLVAADPDLKENLELVHELLGKVLFVVALGHIGAALWHHFHLKDHVLRGMMSSGAVLVGAVIAAVGIGWLGTVKTAAAPDIADPASLVDVAPAADEAPEARAEVEADIASTLPLWTIRPQASEIAFVGEQAGAAFTGRFNEWAAEIRFDEERLAESSAVVTITLASVFTDDSDRDSQLLGDEWFGDRNATFRASEFVAAADGTLTTTGATLTIGGEPYPVDFSFSVAVTDAGRMLEGEARLDRLAINVGTGEWRDTTWVGQYVDVRVTVVAD